MFAKSKHIICCLLLLYLTLVWPIWFHSNWGTNQDIKGHLWNPRTQFSCLSVEVFSSQFLLYIWFITNINGYKFCDHLRLTLRNIWMIMEKVGYHGKLFCLLICKIVVTKLSSSCKPKGLSNITLNTCIYVLRTNNVYT